MMTKTPRRGDLEKAKVAVRWDDETTDRLLEAIPTDNDPHRFIGDKSDLSDIRRAMKRYEEREASIGEDKAFYDARFRLQFLEVDDE